MVSGFFSSINPFSSAKEKPSPVKDLVKGTIYRVHEDFLERFVNREKYEISGLNIEEDVIEEIAVLEAQWTKYVKIGGKDYWRMNQVFPAKLVPQRRILPSDSDNRPDLIQWCLQQPF